MPGSEGVANVIDGTQSKYLNFDGATKPTGFVVTPSVGGTVINGISMQSANDAPERDPLSITIEGSNDDSVTNFTSGTWEMVYKNTAIPAFATRYQTQTFLFDNYKPFKHYRWTVLVTQAANTCCMQIAEVQLLGAGAPKNVIQPGDPVIASSSNMPGSEGVANVIDGTQSKYLNFDGATKPTGFIVTPSIGASTITGIFMESANDAPERDPLSITVEGSNDDSVTNFTSGTWEMVYKNTAIPAFATRYETQTFYFPNTKSYKHYRWTVLLTQTDNSCCMQIAEVGLLAVTSQTDCSKSAFLVQPMDTPVLLGSQATFYTTVNGPWPLQWYVNDKAIPGATAVTYATDPVTAALATNIYTVQIVGCQTSSPVKAVIFTPSSTKSIAVQFGGGGANGAGPQGGSKYLLTDDIIGVQQQAFWNIATNDAASTGTSGDAVTLPETMLDSDGKSSSITFEYTTSGRWGAGTGTDTPTQKLLNGTAGATSIGTDQTMTFHNVPTGKHSVLVYVVSAPLQFTTLSYAVGDQKYFVRAMNADEYKPAPGFYRATSTDANAPSIANFIRFDNVSADASGDVILTFVGLAGTANATGVNAIQLVLNSGAVQAPPAITMDPQPSIALDNGVLTLTVTATGNGLSYQWRKNGRNLADGGNVSGATTAKLIISPFTAADEAVYSVAVFNAAGSVTSKNATASESKFEIQDALIGYWKFDETSGTSAANAVAGGKPAKFTGTAAWAAGEVGNSVKLDAATDGVVESYPKSIRALSASAWVKVDSSLAGTTMTIARNGEASLRSPGDGSAVPAGQFELLLNFDANESSYKPFAQLQAGPNFPQAAAATALSADAWHQVGFTADGAQLRLYVDGQQVAVTDYLSDLKQSTVDFLSIGARHDTNDVPEIIIDATPNYFGGQMDELAIWNRALPADEIAKVYAAGKAGKALTTVVLTKPVTVPPTLSAVKETAGLTITYTGTLQSADTITGQWSDVTGAASPYVAPVTGAQKYFRTKQ
jgi:hypothetical protein